MKGLILMRKKAEPKARIATETERKERERLAAEEQALAEYYEDERLLDLWARGNALAEQIVPRNPGEDEEAWLARVAIEVFNRIRLPPSEFKRLASQERIAWLMQSVQTAAHEPYERTEPGHVSKALTGTEYQILRQLAHKHPQLMKITDLAADLDCRRTAASEAIERLTTSGLVVRPNGERSGVTITEDGLAAMLPCDRPPHLSTP
jgi:DNA-binding MarR family transcriptional regulator